MTVESSKIIQDPRIAIGIVHRSYKLWPSWRHGFLFHGEDHSRIARVLKILEFPEPVLAYLRTHATPWVVGYFTEGRLRDLVALKDPRRIWQQFQEMIRALGNASEQEK